MRTLRRRHPAFLAVTAAVAAAASTPAVSAQPAPEWTSGEPIRIGSGKLGGRIAVGVSTGVVGAVNVQGREPWLFTTAGKFSAKQGLFVYRPVERAETGVPVFGDPLHVEVEGENGGANGAVFSTADGRIHGFWLRKKHVHRTTLDAASMRFVESHPPIELEDVPFNPECLTVITNVDGSLELVLGLKDDTPQRPTDAKNWRDPAYRPFDGAGVYRGGWPYAFLHVVHLDSPDALTASRSVLASATTQEALLSYVALTTVNLGPGRERDVIAGSWFGNLYYYANRDTQPLTLAPHRLLADAEGVALRHPTIRPAPLAYPNADTGLSDLIVGGEGALYYYRFTGTFSERGAPVYAPPQPVLEMDAPLYAGSLPVIDAVDWNGDGKLDLIAGNSEGRILFFQNDGTDAHPAFRDGVEVEADGHEIHIQPGYSDIQGPQEARWGYASPTVVDWDGDGLLDIVTSSATAMHEVFLNRGTPGAPKLERPNPLYLRGLELHGTWRVRPGVAKLGDRMAYVALDDQDEFHLYWQIDRHNLEDGGKLRLEDGSTIRANFLSAGGTGRLKFTLADWDRDGKTDLLVGTPRHGSVPNPESGLPQSQGLKGASVLFLKNVGSDAAPVFGFPVMMQFKGKPLYLGQHECSAAVWDVGQPDGPDLLVGAETGRVLFYRRSDLGWSPPAMTASDVPKDAHDD